MKGLDMSKTKNEMKENLQFDDPKEVSKKLEEVRIHSEQKLKKLQSEQDRYGIIEHIYGGYAYRLGNEIEDFDGTFGFAENEVQTFKKVEKKKVEAPRV